MNGVHDLGGMHGFGPVIIEPDEPVFHEPWEGRVYGMLQQLRRKYQRNSGHSRSVIESMEPVRYLTASYYERFLEAAVQTALEEGLVTDRELAARIEQLRATPGALVPTRSDPAEVQQTLVRLKTQPPSEPPTGAPLFRPGDGVQARNLNWPGHNRLPRYIRGKRGWVERINGWYTIEDANAGALGRNPQPVYTVGFEGREVWGEGCEPNLKVYLELWEGYLLPGPE